MPLIAYSDTPKVGSEGLARSSKAMGGGEPPRGGSVRPRSGAGSRRRGLPGTSRCQGGLTRLEGSRGPFGRGPESSDEGTCSGPRGLGGSRTRGAIGEGSRGEETQESIDRQDGATQTGRERIRRGIEASKQVKLAEWSDSAARSPERPGSGPRLVERELIVAGGVRQPRESVGVDETGGDKAAGGTLLRAGG